MKNIFVILDGASGRNNEFKNQSSLEAAKMPNLDYFAKEGVCGLVRTVGVGIAPESDVAVVSLLGYDYRKYFTGRGPFEAYGAGIRLKKPFVAFRTNFATVKDGQIVERRAGRTLTTKEAKGLAKAINEEVILPCKFDFKSTIGHRGILVFYGNYLPDVSNIDPAYKMKGKFGVASYSKKKKLKEAKALKKGSEMTACLLNSFVNQSIKILNDHQINKKRIKRGLLSANLILPRDAGNNLPKFPQKKGWAAVVSMPLEIGIADLAGMDILKFDYPECKTRNVYKFLYQGLNKTIEASLDALNNKWDKYNSFYLHFKECDIPGHDGLPAEKMKMLELIDKNFFSKLKKFTNFKLIVTSDHATPCKLKAHSSDPVALLLYDGKRKDKVQSFSERACKKGKIGIILGKNVLKLL
ncbi:MAG: alkaline phosphatase family protein [Nanoarchaeota archaeon]|nr:alkaline phosphatase family protein [Nanoarchaeota archaeon]